LKASAVCKSFVVGVLEFSGYTEVGLAFVEDNSCK
jgi:hypothetical protein